MKTLILSRSDVMELLSLRDYIEAVGHAFRLRAERRTFGPGVLGIRATDGSFQIRAAGRAGVPSFVLMLAPLKMMAFGSLFGLLRTQSWVK